MNDKITIHEDSNIGLKMEGMSIREVIHHSFTPPLHFWVATAKIGSIFGSEVEGECRGIGATREQALERLKEDQRRLAESLWA